MLDRDTESEHHLLEWEHLFARDFERPRPTLTNPVIIFGYISRVNLQLITHPHVFYIIYIFSLLFFLLFLFPSCNTQHCHWTFFPFVLQTFLPPKTKEKYKQFDHQFLLFAVKRGSYWSEIDYGFVTSELFSIHVILMELNWTIHRDDDENEDMFQHSEKLGDSYL